MASTVVAVADMVAARLAAAEFSEAVSVDRKWRPVKQLKDLKTACITVVPSAQRVEAEDRDADVFTVPLEVGIQKRVASQDDALLDNMSAFTEEVIDCLRRDDLAGDLAASFLSLENEPLYADEHLDEENVYTSVLIVSYEVSRLKPGEDE